MRIVLNGETKECPSGITIEKLLELYKIDKHRTAVELNREIIPKREHSTKVLKTADVVEVVTFVGGG